FNNPCLEYWLLLHFKQTTKYFPNYKFLEKELKKIDKLRGYEKKEKYYLFSKGTLYGRLKAELPTAIQNAKLLAAYDSEQSNQALCNMYKVMEYFGVT
ncbi:MAG: RloB family protein, partial [Bacteroidales bacterium]|nr:RloB family protein [Bacteroidales bacterium]